MIHTRYYKVAGITVQLDSELPIDDTTFADKFRLFETSGPGEDNAHLVHRFFLPDITAGSGQLFYSGSPWMIYKNGDNWVYVLETSPDPAKKAIRQISFVNADHTRAEIFNGDLCCQAYKRGGLHSLTLSPTDQILLARLLADRSGCYLHSDGVNMDGRGYLFAGPSGAGKSTIAELLQNKTEILCDDRMIVRKWHDGYHIHGNWSHGTMPVVSASSAPLSAIFFLEKSLENRVVPVDRKIDAVTMLFGCIVKPLVTTDWWEKMLGLFEEIVRVVPCYRLLFDQTGAIYEELTRL